MQVLVVVNRKSLKINLSLLLRSLASLSRLEELLNHASLFVNTFLRTTPQSTVMKILLAKMLRNHAPSTRVGDSVGLSSVSNLSMQTSQ